VALPIDLEVKVERLRRTISKYPAHEKVKNLYLSCSLQEMVKIQNCITDTTLSTQNHSSSGLIMP